VHGEIDLSCADGHGQLHAMRANDRIVLP
jgi:hypothetical protein